MLIYIIFNIINKRYLIYSKSLVEFVIADRNFTFVTDHDELLETKV